MQKMDLQDFILLELYMPTPTRLYREEKGAVGSEKSAI